MRRPRVTVIEIAQAAGVSKSTVSLVLQGSSLVKGTTRAKVVETMSELGYVYNRGAANLRQTGSKSGIVGVVVNDLTNGFFAELAVGVDMVVQSAGFVQFLSNTSESIDRQREVVASMREHGISGLLVSPARGTDAADFAPLVEAGIPVVVVVRSLLGGKLSSVVADNPSGVASAVRHLSSLGHRRISFLGGFQDTAVFHERLLGYRSAVTTAGFGFDESLVVPAAPSRAGGAEAIARALAVTDRPTAAVCFNDAVAFGACDGLRSHRLEPGRDFAIVGFDDVIEARSAVPALTTVSVDPQAMGRRAGQLLLKQIAAGNVSSEAIMTSVRLVVRESCGARELAAQA
jgi:LacI family transcriptional regulator